MKALKRRVLWVCLCHRADWTLMYEPGTTSGIIQGLKLTSEDWCFSESAVRTFSSFRLALFTYFSPCCCFDTITCAGTINHWAADWLKRPVAAPGKCSLIQGTFNEKSIHTGRPGNVFLTLQAPCKNLFCILNLDQCFFFVFINVPNRIQQTVGVTCFKSNISTHQKATAYKWVSVHYVFFFGSSSPLKLLLLWHLLFQKTFRRLKERKHFALLSINSCSQKHFKSSI